MAFYLLSPTLPTFLLRHCWRSTQAGRAIKWVAERRPKWKKPLHRARKDWRVGTSRGEDRFTLHMYMYAVCGQICDQQQPGDGFLGECRCYQLLCRNKILGWDCGREMTILCGKGDAMEENWHRILLTRRCDICKTLTIRLSWRKESPSSLEFLETRR